uniref:Uncharacterized protein n=1 Tax=Romanomermis culicivorax TaxID=13658 RepID=A0A915I4N3_ROMCU
MHVSAVFFFLLFFTLQQQQIHNQSTSLSDCEQKLSILQSSMIYLQDKLSKKKSEQELCESKCKENCDKLKKDYCD